MILKYALTALVAALSVQAQAATITLTGPQSVALGDTFQLNVHVQQPFDGDRAGDELLAFGMDVLFDESVLALTNVALAPVWNDDASLTGVTLSGSAFPGITDQGQAPLPLARLSFKVLGTGSVQIRLMGDAATSFNHGLIYLSSPTLSVSAGHTVIASVPEPHSIALVLAGLAGLAAFRGRRGA